MPNTVAAWFDTAAEQCDCRSISVAMMAHGVIAGFIPAHQIRLWEEMNVQLEE